MFKDFELQGILDCRRDPWKAIQQRLTVIFLSLFYFFFICLILGRGSDNVCNDWSVRGRNFDARLRCRRRVAHFVPDFNFKNKNSILAIL